MSTLNVSQVNTTKGGSLASQTTLPASFWTSGQLVPVSGTTSITGIADAPSAGIYRTILAEGAFPLTDNGSTFRVFGGTQTVVAGDLIDVYATTTTTFYCRINGIGKKEVDTAKATALNSATATGLLALAAVANTTVTGLKAADADTVSGYGIGTVCKNINNGSLTTIIASGLYEGTSVTGGIDASRCFYFVNVIDVNNKAVLGWRLGSSEQIYTRSMVSGVWAAAWGTIWSSNSDGNGGQPPAPKPTLSTNTNPGYVSSNSFAAGLNIVAPGAGTDRYVCLVLAQTVSTKNLLPGYCGYYPNVAGGATIYTVPADTVSIAWYWRTS